MDFLTPAIYDIFINFNIENNKLIRKVYIFFLTT
jgi:hypothetical protein